MNLEAELSKRFGYDTFRPGQKTLIEAVLTGKDALGVMPTGGGKSLCFQLPAAILNGTALVISPLIALMKDQVDALRARGIAAEGYHSGLTAREKRAARQALAAGTVKLLYMAPERIQSEEFMELLTNTPLSFLAIDEAHCISHWGHDFRPDYRKLGDLRQFLRSSDDTRSFPVIGLTATATQRVQVDIVERLHMHDPVQVITGFRRDNLSFTVKKCSGRADKFATLQSLVREALDQNGSSVIYAATRKNVELVAETLQKSPLKKHVAYYHAGLSDSERETAQDEFLSGEKQVLIATNAFGMGIDKSNVRLVAHYDIPGSVEAYYQEAGRAGRDQKPAKCVLLFNHADIGMQEFFIDKTAGENEERIESQKALLKQLVRYAYASTCRQHLVLGYFGDPEAEGLSCGLCDNCNPQKTALLETDETTAQFSRVMLATVARLNGRFGKTRICEILKGSESAGITSLGLQQQSTYGALKSVTLARIKELTDLLTEAGYLQVVGLEYPVLRISATGVSAMKGETAVLLPRPWADFKAKKASSRNDTNGESFDHDVDSNLLSELKTFRNVEARRKKVPAYVIFHDKTLVELASKKPRALDELSEITGFGPKKLSLYGEAVLAILHGEDVPF